MMNDSDFKPISMGMTMKAVVNLIYGGPEVLEIRDMKTPVPKDNEVCLKIHASTVNRTDCAQLRAKPFFARLFTGLFKPKESTGGSEFAGDVIAIGKAVSLFSNGDKVFGFKANAFGAHAQFMCISEDKALIQIPENISYEQAAASTEGAFYAYNFINKVPLRKGDKVLVNGASGGIGSAMVQLLAHYGAEVTAVCTTKNIELVKSLGATTIFDYTRDDFTKSKDRYPYIFDAVGKSSFGKCRRLLEKKGVYISSELGVGWQNIFLALFTPLFGGKKVIFPMPVDSVGFVKLLKELMEQGKYRSVIDRTFPLDQIADAYRYVESGQKTGNVVIKIQHN